MSKKLTHPKIESYGGQQVPAFGYELLRSTLLPELLGDEQKPILYWAGRKAAKTYPLDTIEGISSFFQEASWGNLNLDEKSKNKMIFTLTSELITARLKANPDIAFSLEAGFLAEQIQSQLGCFTETHTEVKTGKQKSVIFQVKWDKKDTKHINSERPAAD